MRKLNKDVMVACDFSGKAEVMDFLGLFTEEKPFVKIGMELYYAEGPDIVRAVNTAAFLPARTVYAAYPVQTGLRETDVVCGETFTIGGMTFRFEAADRLTLSAQGCVAEFAFDGGEGVLSADLFAANTDGRLKYLLKNGIIKAL